MSYMVCLLLWYGKVCVGIKRYVWWLYGMIIWYDPMVWYRKVYAWSIRCICVEYIEKYMSEVWDISVLNIWKSICRKYKIYLCWIYGKVYVDGENNVMIIWYGYIILSYGMIWKSFSRKHTIYLSWIYGKVYVGSIRYICVEYMEKYMSEA